MKAQLRPGLGSGYFGFTTNLTPTCHMISFAASHQGHVTHTDPSGALGLSGPTASTAPVFPQVLQKKSLCIRCRPFRPSLVLSY
jgi:hypothetical protein